MGATCSEYVTRSGRFQAGFLRVSATRVGGLDRSALGLARHPTEIAAPSQTETAARTNSARIELKAHRFVPELALIQAGVEAPQLQQLSVGSLLHDSTPIQNDQPVGPADGAEPLRDDQSGPADQQLGQCVLDQPLTLGVQAAGCLI